MGLRLSATDKLGKERERWIDALLFLVFPWDWLTVTKIQKNHQFYLLKCDFLSPRKTEIVVLIRIVAAG